MIIMKDVWIVKIKSVDNQLNRIQAAIDNCPVSCTRYAQHLFKAQDELYDTRYWLGQAMGRCE